MKPVNVYVGYGWQKAKNGMPVNPRHDVIWTSIRDCFKATKQRMASRENARIDLRRLRAGIGETALDSIVRMIERADVLIFDIGYSAKPITFAKRMVDVSNVLTDFNRNVLLEVGIAIGMKKEMIIMCPHRLLSKIPSDLLGKMLVTYSGKICATSFNRALADAQGTLRKFHGMVKRAARRHMQEAIADTQNKEV